MAYLHPKDEVMQFENASGKVTRSRLWEDIAARHLMPRPIHSPAGVVTGTTATGRRSLRRRRRYYRVL